MTIKICLTVCLIHSQDRFYYLVFLPIVSVVFDLFPEYSLKKQFDYRGKPYACVLVNKDCELCAGFEEEKIFHLFCFFVQTQTHLREEYEGN